MESEPKALPVPVGSLKEMHEVQYDPGYRHPC